MIEYNMMLYKKDSKGKLRFLNVSTGLVDGEHSLIQESGLVGSQNIVKHVRPCKPKNIGRSNETSAQEQAWKMADSKIKEKLKGGYFEDEYSAMNTVIQLPMLAKSYKDEKSKIEWGVNSEVFIQPKFDGQRCLAFLSHESGEVKLMSRLGNEIDTMPHIVEELGKIAMELKTDVILDGELYCHGLNFQENMRLIKKNRPESTKIDFHVYDVVLSYPFLNRNGFIHTLGLDRCSYVKTVQTLRCLDEENIRNSHANFVSLGYEGSMIRHGVEEYKMNKRSSQLLKNKDFLDIALPIAGVRMNDANSSHGTPWFEWEGAVADRLYCGVKGTHEFRADLLENKDDYIGKIAELRFFEYSEDGVPRFPVMVGIRNDKA